MNKLLIVATVIGLSFASVSAYAERTKRFDRVDTNSDGYISLDEHLEFHRQKFLALDADGDQLLTKEEIKSSKKKRRFDRADTNGDGFLSEEEVLAIKGGKKRR